MCRWTPSSRLINYLGRACLKDGLHNIEQAARDIESGLLDTDLHDTQGLECVVRERHAAGPCDPDRELANRTADAIERNRQMPGVPSGGTGERRR